MRSWLASLRYRWFIATNTLPYTADYLDRVYKIYLNHNKIIHYRDGRPVYSLSAPSIFSKPAAHFFARSLYKTIQNKNTPNMMSFAINDDCNAVCKHCSFFAGVADINRKTMTLAQCQNAIADAQEFGVSVINIVGGEPLLRPDLFELLSSIDKDASTVLMFTNGWLLAEKAEKLKRHGLDSVYVSIDSADAAQHDTLRGKNGLFERALQGVRAAKRAGLSVGISSCITPEAYRDGEFERIIELGKRIGVHEVLIFDAMPTGRFQRRDDLIDNNEWVEEMIQKSIPFNADPSYPGILLWPYATSHRSVGCSCGTSYFYLSPYGDMMSCDFNHKPFGNILELPLYQIWEKMTTMKDFECAKWGGCKIKSSDSRSHDTVSPGRGGCAGCSS